MSTAKEIAERIIADVWPTNNCQGGFIDDVIRPVIEGAVERHMPKPHQVKDRDGDVWEQMNDGKYRLMRHGCNLEEIDRRLGPLTEVQGEPLPDVAALKARIAELEKQTDIPAAVWDCNGDKWESTGTGKYRCMVVEWIGLHTFDDLSKEFGPLSITPPKSKPEPAKLITAKQNVMAAIDQLWGEYAAEVAAKSIDLKVNYTRVIGTLMDVIDDMGASS